MLARLLDPDAWAIAWQGLPDDRREVYFHPAWARASARWEKARAICVHVEAPGGWMLHPTLLHPIEDASDAQTPYGYGGPVFVGDWPAEDRVRALNVSGDLLRRQGVVAEFVRCHTQFSDVGALAGAGYRVFPVRTNVECELDAENFIAAWAPSARRNLRKAISAGLRFRMGTAAEDWSVFETLYGATADRLNMSPFYRFGHAYFEALAKIPGVAAVVVEQAERGPSGAVAAAVVLLGGGLAHYHLGASDFNFQQLRPNDMLYFAMAAAARQAGCRRMIWGGGMSNDPDDTLYRFKSHFGATHRTVCCAGRILDPSRYGALCESWAARNPGRESKMFLKYRA